MQTLGDILRKAREDAGLSLRDLARITGMPTGQLSEIENGVRKDPGFSTVERLAQALSLSLDALAKALREPGFEPSSSVEPATHECLAMLRNAEVAQQNIEELITHLKASIEKPTIRKKRGKPPSS